MVVILYGWCVAAYVGCMKVAIIGRLVLEILLRISPITISNNQQFSCRVIKDFSLFFRKLLYMYINIA